MDTKYWCGLIKAQSGLSDAQIETALEMVDPTGRNFNRWLNGKRAMTHDSIKSVITKARRAGLLTSKKSFGSHAEASAEQRAGAGSEGRASANLEATLVAVRDMHKAKREFLEAAMKLQASCISAERLGIDVLDLFNGELIESETRSRSISEVAGDLAAAYFFDGRLFTL